MVGATPEPKSHEIAVELDMTTHSPLLVLTEKRLGVVKRLDPVQLLALVLHYSEELGSVPADPTRSERTPMSVVNEFGRVRVLVRPGGSPFMTAEDLATGLAGGFSVEDLRRIVSLSDRELVDLCDPSFVRTKGGDRDK
jgi:hypothetical protein